MAKLLRKFSQKGLPDSGFRHRLSKVLILVASTTIAWATIAEALMSTPHYTFETFEPLSSVGYLIKRCGGLIGAAAEKAFEGERLSFTQWTVLIRLRSEGKSMT